MTKQCTFDLRTIVRGFTSARQRVTRPYTARIKVHGEFMEAPADTVDIAIVGGRRIYRGGDRYFLGLINEEGATVRLIPRALPVAGVEDMSKRMASKTTITGAIELMLPTVVTHGDRVLIECGPVIHHAAKAEVLYFGEALSPFGAVGSYSHGFTALPAWTEADAGAYRPALDDSIIHGRRTFSPVIPRGYLWQEAGDRERRSFHYQVEIRAQHPKPLADHTGVLGNAVDVRIEQTASGRWAISNVYRTDKSLIIKTEIPSTPAACEDQDETFSL